MKLHVEIPSNLVKEAYDNTQSASQYDSSGNYVGTANYKQTFIPCSVRMGKVKVYEKLALKREELEKMTKTQLIHKLEAEIDNYVQVLIEVIE